MSTHARSALAIRFETTHESLTGSARICGSGCVTRSLNCTCFCSAWTAKANKRVQFGYGLNYLIDVENAVIVDVEATPARTLTR